MLSKRLPQDYEDLLEGQGIPSPLLVAIPPAGTAEPLVAETMRALGAGVSAATRVSVLSDDASPDRVWQLEVVLPSSGDGGGERLLRVWLEPATPLDDYHFQWARIREEDERAARGASWAVLCETVFGAKPLTEFHDQLKVLAAAADETAVLLDASACRTHSGAWLQDVASCSYPPAPDALFCIHVVGPDEQQDGDRVSLHGHGLGRCGALELEALAIPREHVGSLGNLINTVAPAWIEQGPWPPGETNWIGEGLPVSWLPWTEALKLERGIAQGGLADRDEEHSFPSAVLLAPRRRLLGLFGSALQNPSALVPALEADRVHYLTTMETERMALVAKERFPRLRLLFERLGADEDWVFLLKLAFEVDGAEDESEREHPWFEVHAIGEDEVDATCINQPHAVASLAEGQRGTHSLERLSSWTVFCEHGRLEPDEIVHLERIVEAAASEPSA